MTAYAEVTKGSAIERESRIGPICLLPLIPPHAELPFRLIKRILKGFVPRIRSRPRLWFIQKVETSGRRGRANLQCLKWWEFVQSCRILQPVFRAAWAQMMRTQFYSKREWNSDIVNTLSFYFRRSETITAYSHLWRTFAFPG